MGYANLVGQSCADKAELFCRFRDFLCKRDGTYDYSATGIGWELIDSSYATDEDNPAINDWFVVKSVGESGDDDIYIKITWTNGYFQAILYIYWDAATHTGSTDNLSLSTWMTISDSSATYDLYIYGDLNYFTLIHYDGTYNRSAQGGKIDVPFLDETIAVCSSNLSAGTDVSITVDAIPGSWAVGKNVCIRDDTKIERIEIKTLSSNTITADLVNSYKSGAKIQERVNYALFSGSTFDGYALIGSDGTLHRSISSSFLDIVSYADPESWEGKYYLSPIFYRDSNGVYGRMQNVLKLSSSGLSDKDVLAGSDGQDYRYINIYSNQYIAFREI